MSFFKRLFGKKEQPKQEAIIEEEKIIEVEKADAGEVEPKIETEEEKDIIGETEETVENIIEETKEEIAQIIEETQEEIIESIEEVSEYNKKRSEEETLKIVENIVVEAEKEVEEIIEVAKVEIEEVIEVAEEVTKDTSKIELIEEKSKKKGLFNKLFSGLAKTRDNILGSVDEVLKGFKKIDEDLYEELEEVLIMADFGVDTTMTMMEQLRCLVKERKITEPNELKVTLQEIITNILTAHEVSPIIDETKPNVVLVIGVNGVGKTTSIGKLAHQLQTDGKKVVLAAADTFRAAAIEQLQIWADRADVDLIKHEEGSDPASVVYDGIKAAKARKSDVLICDTAGRLQNKANLMKELEKISRIIEREYPEAHKEVLIVLDATTGQNAISQVKVFKEAAKVDGIVLTKLDGTAKGGAVVGICSSMKVPVKYIGVGEKIEDLQVFDPQSFAQALFHVE